MPNEVSDWRAGDCVLVLDINRMSIRETFSREINETFGEGGALNADYRIAEAVAVAANLLGLHGLEHEKHFRFKTGGGGRVSFDFSKEFIKETAEEILAEFLANTE